MKTGTGVLLLAGCLVAGGIGDSVDYDRGNLDLDLDLDPPGLPGELRRDVRDGAEDEPDEWKGRWMPDRPGEPTPPPKSFPASSFADSRTLHGVPMGRPSPDCDDAKTNLTLDWDGSPIGYTCYGRRIVPDRSARPIEYCERVPKSYVAAHKCMHERIEYDDDVPLYGSHRPLWPVYGEYRYLPKQRWLHSLEHGAIVALHHPCANPRETRRFKEQVASCLRRHVISPSESLDEHRPFVLVAWGCRLSMSRVNPEAMIRFVRERALRGPENVARDGDFEEGLTRPAETVSDLEDGFLCPSARVL